MKLLAIIFFIGLVSIDARSQNSIDQIVLKNETGQITDTLNNNSFFLVRNDTLTRFSIGLALSPDHCKSFSIIREWYKKEDPGFRQLGVKKIKIYSKCSNLWTQDENGAYCLQLSNFQLKNEIAKITITDSNDKKLKVKLVCDNSFEVLLKEKVNMFMDKTECNDVQIE